MNVHDVIVLGTGGVGSAAVLHLAQRGLKVLGLDQFEPGHDRGSSHGQTRIIRKAYFEHPDYVPLLHRSYELWDALEKQSGEKLFFPVGLIEIGPPDGIVVPGVLESARQHDLPIDHLTADDLRERFPGFTFPDGNLAVFEKDAGYLLVERCVIAHLACAQQLGAELISGVEVTDWNADAGGVTVKTTTAEYIAKKLVITAGAWAPRLLSQMKVPLRIVRKHLHWFECNDARFLADRGCPGFFYETPEGFFYGFPKLDDRGLKVAEHSGGQDVVDPLRDDRAVEAEDCQRVEQFLREYLPGVTGPRTNHSVCYYTNSPDDHFLIGLHPEHEHVAVSAALCGHGFKFTTVLGEIMADLVTSGTTAHPIEFLRCDRFRD